MKKQKRQIPIYQRYQVFHIFLCLEKKKVKQKKGRACLHGPSAFCPALPLILFREGERVLFFGGFFVINLQNYVPLVLLLYEFVAEGVRTTVGKIWDFGARPLTGIIYEPSRYSKTSIINKYWYHVLNTTPVLLIILLEPQSCCGDKPHKFQVLWPQNGTAVLKARNKQMLRLPSLLATNIRTAVRTSLTPLELHSRFGGKPS